MQQKHLHYFWPHEHPQQKPSCGRISTSGGFCASAIARVQTTLLSCRITGLEKLCSNYTTSSRMLCNLIVKTEIILKFCQKSSVFVPDGCALECHRACLCKSAGGVLSGCQENWPFGIIFTGAPPPPLLQCSAATFGEHLKIKLTSTWQHSLQ